MSSQMCNYLGNAVLSSYVLNGGGDGKGAWMGLFVADPGVAGSMANEVSGGDYQRQRPLSHPTHTTTVSGWSSPGSKTIGNTVAFDFANLPPCTVTYFALCTLQAGGSMLMTLQLYTPLTFNLGDDFKIDANALAFSL